MIRIRVPSIEDHLALIELVRRFPTPAVAPDDVLGEIFRRKLQEPSSYLLVAEEESKLVGYVSGYRHTAFYAGGETAWVDEILVEQGRRGRNIGRALMDAFEERAAVDGCKLVSLATAGASPFYLKLGYETKAGYFKKYLRSAEQAIPADRGDGRRSG